MSADGGPCDAGALIFTGPAAAGYGFDTNASEKSSLIITTNIPFSKWGTIFGDHNIAGVITGRPVHHGRLTTTPLGQIMASDTGLQCNEQRPGRTLQHRKFQLDADTGCAEALGVRPGPTSSPPRITPVFAYTVV